MNWFDIIPGMSKTLYSFSSGFNALFFTGFSGLTPYVDNITNFLSSTIIGAPAGLGLRSIWALLEQFGSLANLFFGIGLPLIIVLLMAKKLIPLI